MSNSAVKEGVLQSVSPSQIKTHLLCPRKWYFEKILKIRQPETANLALGTMMHGQVEDWYEKGITPEHVSAAKVVELPDVPEPGPDILIEQPRDYKMNMEIEGVPVKGRIDLIRPPDESGQFLVVDWKSTKDWRWVKSPEELARDPQCAVYLEYGTRLFPEATSGLFTHGYMHTMLKRGGARVSSADPKSVEEIHESFDTLRPVVVAMKQTAAAESVEDTEPIRSACDAFGGCFYKKEGLCPGVAVSKGVLVDFDNDSSNNGEDGMSLKERLAAKRREQEQQKPEPTEEQEVAEAAAEIPEEPEVTAPPVDELPEPKVARRRRTSAINPPDAPEPEAPAPKAEETPSDVTAPITGEGFTLYIGCRPDAEEVTDVADIIAEHTPGLLAAIRKGDTKAVPAGAVDLRECAFGTGVAALVAFLRKNPPSGNVYAGTVGLSATAAEVLKPLASRVVRAVS